MQRVNMPHDLRFMSVLWCRRADSLIATGARIQRGPTITTATTPDVKPLVSDYEDLLSGDASKLNVVSESFTYYGPGMPEDGLQGRDAYGEFLQSHRGAFP